MEATYENEKYYELIALSKISEITKDEDEKTLYNLNIIKERDDYKNENLTFDNLFIGDIFNDYNAHLCSFFAEDLYEPKKNTRIFFKGNANKNYS